MIRIAHTIPRVLLIGLLAVAGCKPYQPPVANIQHFLRSPQSVSKLNSVTFVSLHPQAGTPEIADGITEALSARIRSKGLFHVDVISNDNAICEGLPLLSRQAFTMRELAEIRDALQCDAVLLGSVNHFRSYPRMELGLYVRLLDLKNGNLVWGVDHNWDTDDLETRRRMALYCSRETAGGTSPSQYDLCLMSPRAMSEFIAYEAANTLPDAFAATENKK